MAICSDYPYLTMKSSLGYVMLNGSEASHHPRELLKEARMCELIYVSQVGVCVVELRQREEVQHLKAV